MSPEARFTICTPHHASASRFFISSSSARPANEPSRASDSRRRRGRCGTPARAGSPDRTRAACSRRRRDRRCRGARCQSSAPEPVVVPARRMRHRQPFRHHRAGRHVDHDAALCAPRPPAVQPVAAARLADGATGRFGISRTNRASSRWSDNVATPASVHLPTRGRDSGR
jgi:hypothetical protein